MDECFENPCTNGKCITQKDGSAYCDCEDGYKGQFCDGNVVNKFDKIDKKKTHCGSQCFFKKFK